MLEGKDINLEIEDDEEAKAAMGNIVMNAIGADNVKNYGRWGLYAIKAEITIHELRQCLYWQSVIEIGIIAFAFVFLLVQARFLIFLQILHILRPVICCKLISSLPKSHDIYEELPSLSNSSAMQPIICAHFQRGNKVLTQYLIISAFCAILDLIGLIISLFLLKSDHNADAVYTFVVWVLFCFDIFLVFWQNTLRWEYPDEIWQNFRSVLKSGFYAAQDFISTFMQNLRNRFRRN